MTIKLNDDNYLLWAQSFKVFVGVQRKLDHLLLDPPAEMDPKYSDWVANDCCVIIWLLNSMEEKVSPGVMFLPTAKQIWDTLKEVYGNDKNISRVFELYGCLFTLQQGDMSVPEFYSTLKSILDELDVHQPLLIDLKTLKGYRQDLAVAKFLSGAGVSGHLSDAFLGRKGTLILTSFMNSTFGMLTSLSPSFPFYAALRFLTGLFTGGVGLSAFVLATEPVGSTKRGPVSMFTFYFFSLGAITLALTARSTPSWRSLYIVSSIPSLIFALVILLFITESPRWHLVHGDVSAAMCIMRSIAKTNNRYIPDNVFLTMEVTKHAVDKGSKSIIDVFRSPIARSRLSLSVAINFLISIIYYGLTLNVRNLSTNLYLSVMLNAVAEMPAYAMTALLVRRCGRRPLAITTAWLATTFCIAASMVGEAVRTACGMIGIFFATATFNLLFIYTAELFPTAVRNTALGFVTQAGQMGAVVAPMVVILGRHLSFMVFGVCGLVGGVLGFRLPETLNLPLYETMEELEGGERRKEGGDGCDFGFCSNEVKRENKSFA